MRMRNTQLTPIIALLVLAIIVFGTFIIFSLSNTQPADTPEDVVATDTDEAVEEAPATEEADITATAEEAEATEPAPAGGEATAMVTPAAVAEDQATSTAAAAVEEPTPEDEQGQAAPTEEAGEPTPTSRSRVLDSILIGTPVTPNLVSTLPAPAGGDGAGDPTPTSLSRVADSILIGTPVTPALVTTIAAPGSGDGQGEPTPTSHSRVPSSIILGQGSQSSGMGEQSSPDQAPAESTAEATPETTEQAAAIRFKPNQQDNGGGDQPLPSPVPGMPNGAPNFLIPKGPVAERQAGLFWIMLGIGTVIYIGVMILLIVAVRSRRDEQHVEHGHIARESAVFILGGGVVLPIVILTILFALTLGTMAVLALNNTDTSLTVRVTGYRWWWQVEYPDYGFVTANEIHIPAGQPIRFELTSSDVIHSFWVPELGGKLDLFPGRINDFWLQADHPGEYRGQCAEFCGIQHAKMAFLVIAETPEDFEAWVNDQQQPAREPQTELAQRGQEVFLNSQCIACHTIRGTSASGIQGPDLTHFGSRLTIGAATVANNTGNLGGWIANSQGIKPGNLMPPQDIDAADLQAVIAYLQSLE